MNDITSLLISVTVIGAYITGIVNSAMTSNVVMLILDLVIPPVGIIHGIGIWFGAW
jgi:hypothetical protein